MYETTNDYEFLDISLNSTEATERITDLKMNGTWVNHNTQQLLVTVMTYNGQIDEFSIARLQMDFRDSVKIELKALTKAIPDYREQDLFNVALLGCIYIALGIWLMFLESAIAPLVVGRGLLFKRLACFY
ncbi:unnamed protein product [Phytophthora lilii]|uniref:Unnamed protein product n=1 Tax=Phytophthora lilii TaxID=2077276 RepID=A0A9W6TGU4_9STRA|nr:unnamed protein product [Phytophthora lilii]